MDDLLTYLAPREEKLTLGGVDVVVRELPSAADTMAFRDPSDSIYKLMVRCTFTLEGKPVFTDEHIPALKVAAHHKLAPLLIAVSRVNGRSIEAEAGNSDAGPSSG